MEEGPLAEGFAVPDDPLPRDLYAVEAAALLRVHPNTIVKMIQRGQLRGIKIAARYRIPREDVEALLAAVR